MVAKKLFYFRCMNQRDMLLFVLEFAAVVHLVYSMVTFNFARRTVRYLSQAWVLLIIGCFFAFGMVGLLIFPQPSFEILSPYLLIALLVCSFLQSIYPLSIPMPGYLQWGRMWRYASPAIALIAIYIVGGLMGSHFTHLNSLDDLRANFLNGDVLLRLLMLGLTFYYILNIFRLPHNLLPNYKLQKDLIFYGTALCFSAVFMVVLSIRFNAIAFVVYVLYFTAVNVALAMRVFKPILQLINVPDINPVKTPPTDENLQRETEENFNELNLKRFEKVEYVMQHQKPFTDCDFTREHLCREVGLNRHLLLQCLRANGYNDVHEYISRYRVAELKRLIEDGTIKDLRSIEKAGFRTMKTALISFERFENTTLPDFFEAHQDSTPTQSDETTEPSEEMSEE